MIGFLFLISMKQSISAQEWIGTAVDRARLFWAFLNPPVLENSFDKMEIRVSKYVGLQTRALEFG